jgi:hypothetical protein
MRSCSLCYIGEGVEHGAVAGDLEGLDCGGIGFVRRRIGGDGRRKLLGRKMKRGAEKHGSSEEGVEAHG